MIFCVEHPVTIPSLQSRLVQNDSIDIFSGAFLTVHTICLFWPLSWSLTRPTCSCAETFARRLEGSAFASSSESSSDAWPDKPLGQHGGRQPVGLDSSFPCPSPPVPAQSGPFVPLGRRCENMNTSCGNSFMCTSCGNWRPAFTMMRVAFNRNTAR